MQSFEEAKKLGEILAIFKAHGHPSAFRGAELTEDRWGAAYFVAEVLLRCKLQDDLLLSRERLEALRERFLLDTGFGVDLDDLFQKGWLRFVFGSVWLSAALTSRHFNLDFIRQYENDIRFFEGLTDEQRAEAKTLVQLQALIDEYQKEHTLMLKTCEVADKFYTVGPTGHMTYHNVRIYAYTLDNLKVFEFIKLLIAPRYEKPLFIAGKELAALHRRHSEFFPETPSLRQLKEKGVFKLDSTGNSYFVYFYSGNFGESHQVLNNASGLLWDMLLKQGSHGDSAEKLRFWYYRTVFHSEHLDFASGFSAANKKKFLDTALQMVLNEPDLEKGDAEYHKLRLDNRHTYTEHVLPEYYALKPLETISLSGDLFLDFERLESLNNGHGTELLLNQGCRYPISFLIGELVEHDDPYNFDYTHQLLKQSVSKPYLFWHAGFTLRHSRPAVLPFLMKEDQSAAFAFQLLMDVRTEPLAETGIVPVKNELIAEGFDLLIGVLVEDIKVPEERKAKIVFQCLGLITNNKFRVQFTGNSLQQKKYEQQQVWLSARVRETLMKAVLPGQVFTGYHKYKHLFFPALLKEFGSLAAAMQPPGREVGQVYLPYVKLDLLAFIYELSLRTDQIGERVADDTASAGYLRLFLNTYVEAMNCRHVMKATIPDKELKPDVPYWMTNTSRDELIDWGTLLLHMEKHFMLEDFLAPEGLSFTHSTNAHDEYNAFVATKMRNHISIIISAYNSILRKVKQASIAGLHPEGVLRQLEVKLTNLIRRFCLFEPASGRYDIFNERLERWSFGSARTELLPVIGTVINKFDRSNRQGIVEELIRAEQVIRSLKLVDYVVGEAERMRLLNIIVNEKDIPGLMNKLSYADQQFLIQSLTSNEAFVEQAEAALIDSDNPANMRKLSHQEQDNKLYHFRAQLLLAYHHKDLKAVEKAQDPALNIHGFSAQQERSFYEALIRLELDQPEKAYQLFNQLLSDGNTDKPVFALNRFAAHLNWAARTVDLDEKQRRYADALAEWETYEKTADRSISDPVSEKVTLNKLEALNALEEDTKFDELYVTLDRDIRLKPHFLTVGIRNLVRRKMQPHAEQLLLEAKQVHLLPAGGYPDFIARLEDLANTPETIAYLAEQHNRILNLPPEKLVQVISGNGVAVVDLPTFLLDEILEAAGQMLLKINAISDVRLEDKYSDLMMLVLNSRLQHFHWTVQTMRGGYSDPKMESGATAPDESEEGSNVGEIDFGIFGSGQEMLAICEALNLEGKNTAEVQKHNLKIFNYHPARKLFFVISYYKGAPDKFESAWGKYTGVVENFIDFPAEYELNGQLQPLTRPKTSATVKAANSKHGTDTTIYHVFININYKLELDKKAVRTKKTATVADDDDTDIATGN